VLGDRYGASASPSLMRHAELSFEAFGFSTGRNAPYAGGYTTRLYAQRERSVQALQIELNRSLYLDEERIERGAHFDEIRARLTGALKRLLGVDVHTLHMTGPRPLAAE